MNRLTAQVTVETDRFEHREVKPHFINPCCFGEDFAAWLKQELSHCSELGMELSEPIPEDYGWGLWASCGKDRFWIALSYVDEGPREAAAEWVISVDYAPGLNLMRRLHHAPDEQTFRKLSDFIRRVLQSDDMIKIIEQQAARETRRQVSPQSLSARFQAGILEDCVQRPGWDVGAVDGEHHAPFARRMLEDRVAAGLPSEDEAIPLKNSAQFARLHGRPRICLRE